MTDLGCEVSYQPKLKDETLAQAVREWAPDILVVRSTKVTEEIVAAGRLKLIVRAGAGYNTIDVAAASRRGIYVSNCPGKNSIAVAELAFGLMLALDRRIADNVIKLRQGEWNKTEFSKARGLYGRTLGLIGLGQIGREMIPRARAFGMQVVAWSRSLKPLHAAELGIGYKPNVEQVAASAEVVSVHVALTRDTRGFLGAPFFQAMRPGAYFINTARGEVVDQAALVEALRSGHIRAGLDVFAEEPASGADKFSDEIAREPGLYGTHHIGASTEQAQEAIAAESVRIVKHFMESGQVPNVVNIAKRTAATCVLVVRHRDCPGVLAQVLDAIRVSNINVQEMENTIFEGAEAAIARVHLEQEPSRETLDRLQAANPHIIELSLIRLD